MKNSFAIGFMFLLFGGLNAQTTLLEESFTSGIPSDWTVVDNDNGLIDSSLLDFNDAWIAYQTSFDTCAASTSYYQDVDSSLIADDYLITPALNLLSFGSILSWQSKSFDASYLEAYYVLVSTTDTDISSFTDTIKIVNAAVPFWKSYSLNLLEKGYSDQTVYVTFKNASQNKFILGIDEVKVTTNDPASIENENTIDFNIYPNPVSSILNVSIDIVGEYAIYDQVGRLCQTGNGNQIDISTLVSGRYFISIKNNDTISQKSFVKE